MESALVYVLFIACFLSFLSSAPTPVDARASPLVRSVCKQTRDSYGHNYTECVKTLWSDTRIRSSASNDVKDLAINVLEIAAESAIDTQELFNSYLQMIKSSSNGSKAIQQCAQSYGSAALAFRGAVDGVKDNDDRVNYTVARIVNDLNACDNVLSSDGVHVPNTISTRVHMVKLYMEIGTTITHL